MLYLAIISIHLMNSILDEFRLNIICKEIMEGEKIKQTIAGFFVFPLSMEKCHKTGFFAANPHLNCEVCFH